MTRWIALALMLVATGRAAADPDDDHPVSLPDPTGPDIVITSPGERTLNNKLAIGGVAGAGAALGGIGLYFHLDALSARDRVANPGKTPRPWTSADQADYDHAHSSGVKAAVFYSIGGAALLGAAIALIATEPVSETKIIHPHRARPAITPAPGGAILGGSWTF
jgi:hypothetical protein